MRNTLLKTKCVCDSLRSGSGAFRHLRGGVDTRRLQIVMHCDGLVPTSRGQSRFCVKLRRSSSSTQVQHHAMAI